jgi:predicted phage gp36 major capsid-like protein
VPRRCSVCQHPERQAIDRALAIDHEPYRVVAERFTLNRSSVERHKKHLAEVSAELVCAAGMAADSLARDQLDLEAELRALVRAAKADLEECRKAGDRKITTQLYDKLTKQLELLGRFAGRLEKGGVTVAVQVNTSAGSDDSDMTLEEQAAVVRSALSGGVLLPSELRAIADQLELESAAGTHLLGAAS